ncbi:isoprenylcysteine carboxylmethyltransferase family protein [candidate division WOR-3 bacterium]|nr:isoprenylcysteine carboxylmethyltransferase family protein [candidate division WOR-3 bacterium]
MMKWIKESSPYYIAGIMLIFAWLLLWFLDNPSTIKILQYIGSLIMLIGIILIFLPLFILPRKGKPPKGKDITHTTTIVSSGIYAIVRHPLYLGWSLMYVAIIFWNQHWLIIITGIIGIICVYLISKQEDKQLIKRFGNNYKDYIIKVPGMNLLYGIIKLTQFRRK